MIPAPVTDPLTIALTPAGHVLLRSAEPHEPAPEPPGGAQDPWGLRAWPRRGPPPPWDPRLSDRMAAAGFAVPEEKILESILADTNLMGRSC